MTIKLDQAPVVSMQMTVGEQNVTSSDAHVIWFSSPPHADPTGAQRLLLIEQSGFLDFWNDESEDGYSGNDGEPP